MPRVTTWKVPLALWVTGFILNMLLSAVVSESVARWVAGPLGFLALVTFVMYGYHREKVAREARDTP